MKMIVFWILVLYLASQSNAQTEVSTADWQSDLRFLQQTVHKDYPFLFKKISASGFDAKVEELHGNIPTMQAHEIVAGFARVVSSFQYGHTALRFRGGSVPFHQLPVNLYQFKDGIYIEGAHQDYDHLLGARVTAIAGVPIDAALKKIRPVVPAENDQYFKAYGINYVMIPELLHAQGITKELTNEIQLSLERDGKTFEEMVTGVEGLRIPKQYGFTRPNNDWRTVRDQTKTPLYLKDLERIYFFEYLPESKTVYVRHSQIQDDQEMPIPEFYNRVFNFVETNDVEKLVLDVRLNGGGNNYKNKPVVTGVVACKKINRTGKFFVIIGRRTFSACQNLVNELDNYTNAIFIGEPTAENVNFYGDNRSLVLPNSNYTVLLSFAWWQDKPQWENGPWKAPHIAVDMEFEDYRKNRDPILSEALRFTDENFIRDPMAYLTNLFQSGDRTKLEAESQRLVNDPKYKFFDFESKFNQAGYDLMSAGQLDAAIYVLQQNSKLFPKSANVWDSLGEAYWNAKHAEKAVENYKKAIALDPEGEIGANSRERLKQIEAELNKKIDDSPR